MSGIILGESDHSDSDEWERLGNYFEIIRNCWIELRERCLRLYSLNFVR